MPTSKSIVITGADGRIGRLLARHWAERPLVLLDTQQGDLTTYPAVWAPHFQTAFRVVHLAANPDPAAPFDEAAQRNILATLNVMKACLEYEVQGLIYASSVWADYKAWQLNSAMTWYAASKISGEALVQAWSEQTSRPAVCLRIGGYDPDIRNWPYPLESLRVNEASLAAHFDAALQWNERKCAIRYAVGKT